MAGLEPDEENDDDSKNHHSKSRTVVTTTKGSQAPVRDDGTMAGLESDEENDNDSKKHRSQSQAIVTTTKGDHSKSQAITATTTHDAEYVSDPGATQESEHQDKEEATIDPQDDPQDVDLERGANADSKRGAIARKVTISVTTDTLLE